MARYDAIQGAGNVTVNAPPDFWTSAKQSFDDDYDRDILNNKNKLKNQKIEKTGSICTKELKLTLKGLLYIKMD